MPRPLRIFISYATQDSAAAHAIESWLRGKGHEPWMDTSQLLVGDKWQLEIKKAIASADVVVVCLSRQSVNKTGYVQKELKLILEAAALRPAGKIFALPLRLDDCDIPDGFEDVHYLDWFASDAHERLARALDFESGKSAIVDDLQIAKDLPDGEQSGAANEINTFIQAANMDDVVRVRVITHTGGVTLHAVLAALERSRPKEPAPLHVLMRSPELSDLGRAQAIRRSLLSLREFSGGTKNYQVEARIYASPPLLRCVILEHQGGQYSAYLSFYDWPLAKGLNQRGEANRSTVQHIRVGAADLLLDTFLSWFAHLWGKHRIHTLLFDFDDTLFLTTECQVEAWVEALQSAIDGKTFVRSDLAADIRRVIDRRADLTERMTEIFIKRQQEDEILRSLFKELPALNKLDMLRRHRVRVREELTAQRAIPIWEIIEDIRTLSADYQLAIVSATSEILVRQVLERHGLGDLFAYIIGREVPRHPWLAMENKTQQFLRISNITGIPLERMVFVGDSNADHKSAAQLGLRFLENRHNAARYGVKSLIKSLDPEGHPFITGRPGELVAAINDIETKITRLP
jgi:phosphoglycolate phosphatase-like HAD superfamily hydrolase